MSVEGLLGTDDVFAADLQGLPRPQPGQALSASNMRKAVGRQWDRDFIGGLRRAPRARCLSAAVRAAGGRRGDTIDHAARVAGWELASAVDNPVVTLDDRVESNGNFMAPRSPMSSTSSRSPRPTSRA